MSPKPVLQRLVSADVGLIALFVGAVFLVGGGFSLECKTCVELDEDDWCLRYSIVSCDRSLAFDTHEFMAEINPSLEDVPFKYEPKYQCIEVSKTYKGVTYQYLGCTIANNDICEGLPSSIECITINRASALSKLKNGESASNSSSSHSIGDSPNSCSAGKSAYGDSRISVESVLLLVIVGWAARNRLRH